MDEICTGLDSSTTFQVVKSIKQYAHFLKGTVVISLLQPPPETYNLTTLFFSDGHIVYQGPSEQVLDFLASMDFRCPERKGVAVFLQEVTFPNEARRTNDICGTLGRHSSHLIRYFEIEVGYNPATWMMEIMSPGKEMELGIGFAENFYGLLMLPRPVVASLLTRARALL
ncbi:ABC transporter G family member 36, partial [Mucuna pruriens]